MADSYKQSHYQMYPKNISKLYSNMTARKSRLPGVNSIVFFGLQYFILEYLIRRFNEDFFTKSLDVVISEHTRVAKNYSAGAVIVKQWEELHGLGYLPLCIKAVPEGALVPIGVPMLTITNTDPRFAWLVNFIETILSTTIWQPITSATIANEYRKLTSEYCKKTGGDLSFIDWQNHDFSMRGMSSFESACLSGAGHLTVFKGSDTIPAAVFLEKYYDAKGLIAGSVPASEHSVMSSGGKENEIETFERLIDTFQEGILSIVSDTWDLWTVLTDYLPKLKGKILSRNGKVVLRPDSGNPVDIICGLNAYSTNDEESYLRFGLNYENQDGKYFHGISEKEVSINEWKGVIELLWDVFGGTINEKGYKVLDPHIGAIYGDSITLERADEILRRLETKGFCSTNIVFGIGSFTYQYNTRDTFGLAMKATYCELDGVGKPIYKDPITDDGTKKSAKGLLAVFENEINGKLELHQEVSKATEETGELVKVFENGKLLVNYSLDQIRDEIHRHC